MFDGDGLFDLTDDPFEWDMLLDDDELEPRSVRRALWLTDASLCLYT